jgi:GntP family gluconate:H+ symporter
MLPGFSSIHLFATSTPPEMLLLIGAGSIAVLTLMIVRFKVSAFLALFGVSLAMGITCGMNPRDVISAFMLKFGETFGALGLVVAFGAVLGRLLSESGAATVLADAAVRVFGPKRLDYAIMVVAFVVGVSVFFQVGIVLLGPIVFALARRSGVPVLRLGMSCAAGLSVAHGLIPPHPGPMAAIAAVHANTGATILWSLFVVGPPTALLTGPLLARWVAPRVPIGIRGLGATAVATKSPPKQPRLTSALFTMLLPILLMAAQATVEVLLPDKAHPLRYWFDFIGNPNVAMACAIVVAYWTFGFRCGLDRSVLLKSTEDSLSAVGVILLVVACGGGFSKVLVESGIGAAVAGVAKNADVSLILLAWLVAGVLRIAVGSATVSITACAGLLAELLAVRPDAPRELIVLAMGSGSLIASHVNDGGFWFVKEYFGMTIGETLRSWTIVETGIAWASIVILLLCGREWVEAGVVFGIGAVAAVLTHGFWHPTPDAGAASSESAPS